MRCPSKPLLDPFLSSVVVNSAILCGVLDAARDLVCLDHFLPLLGILGISTSPVEHPSCKSEVPGCARLELELAVYRRRRGALHELLKDLLFRGCLFRRPSLFQVNSFSVGSVSFIDNPLLDRAPGRIDLLGDHVRGKPLVVEFQYLVPVLVLLVVVPLGPNEVLSGGDASLTEPPGDSPPVHADLVGDVLLLPPLSS